MEVKSGIFGGRNGVIDRDRRIVDRVDSNGQRADIGQGAVGDGVINGIDAVKVCRRRIGVAAVGGQYQ